MSLHNLCRCGLLTRETTVILQNLDKNIQFNNVELKLYESGYTSSKSHATRIKSEIKSRINLKKEFLPDLNSLITMANTNFNSIVKGQIYFVYLYNTDTFVSHITDKLGEIFHSNYDNPEISRNTIKNLLITHLNSISIEGQNKTIENWIGKYLSIMREINILIRKRKHDYFINFYAIMPETWYFFILDSYFNSYPLLKSEFFKSFQIEHSTIPDLLQNLENTNSKINKMMIHTIQDWIVNVK
jgi:hypothetical protein